MDPVAETVARPIRRARTSASSLPEDCRSTLTTSSADESLEGVDQLKPGSSTMWMVTPTRVETLHGWVSLVMTTSGLATTPHGGATGSVVVGIVEVGGVVVGLALGGTLDEPQAARKVATARAASHGASWGVSLCRRDGKMTSILTDRTYRSVTWRNSVNPRWNR